MVVTQCPSQLIKEPSHLKACLLCDACREAAKEGAPDRDEAVAEGSDFDIDMHP